MPRGIPLGRIFGTDIHATLGFFGMLALIFYLAGGENVAQAAVWCIAVTLSLLIHEFGHVFAARRLVGGETRVVLWFMGGLCLHHPTDRPKKQLVISLMGPLFGLVAGLLAKGGRLLDPPVGPLPLLWLGQMAKIGLIWTGLNLLPILPLDGGQALRAALAIRRSPARALAVTRRVSVVASAGLAGVGLYLDQRVVTVLAVVFFMQNLSRPRAG